MVLVKKSCFLWRNTCVGLRVQVLINAGVTPTPKSIVLLRGSLLLKFFLLRERRKGLTLLEASIFILNMEIK